MNLEFNNGCWDKKKKKSVTFSLDTVNVYTLKYMNIIMYYFNVSLIVEDIFFKLQSTMAISLCVSIPFMLHIMAYPSRTEVYMY